MAKDVASRVPGDDASAQEARELIERAAAQFASIHERWSALRADTQALDSNSPANALAGEAAALGDESENSAGHEGVRMTPIVGVASSDDDSEYSARPRFKTLLGVPRSSPDIDALAGMDIDSSRRRDTVRLDRPAHPPPARPPAPVAVEAPPATRDEPSLAATSWPWERNAPAALSAPRAMPPQWAALVESSLDVSAEVAALRASSGRRYWFAWFGAVAAVVALFAVGAPRERTLAVRWLRQEYQTRVHPSVDAITDGARALRPSASVAAPTGVPETQGVVARQPPAAAASSADSVPTKGSVPAEGSSRAAAAPDVALPSAPAAPPGDPSTAALLAATSRSDTEASGSMETSSRAAAPNKASTASSSLERARRPAEGSARAKATAATAASPSLRPAARDDGSTSKSRQQVAAPRKRSQRATALATNTTKPRATRQNSPRKDTGGGIIRETPF